MDRTLTEKEWLDAYLDWAWDLTLWAIENGSL